jgi:hypothetical protein
MLYTWERKLSLLNIVCILHKNDIVVMIDVFFIQRNNSYIYVTQNDSDISPIMLRIKPYHIHVQDNFKISV